MGTRCNVILKDEFSEIILYRHSDGYPECTGSDLKEFVKGYTENLMRLDSMQSAGWLILRGHSEYKEGKMSMKPDPTAKYDGWKVGAYEPTNSIHGDIEYLYVIDLEKRVLEARQGRRRTSKLLESHNF